MRLNEHGLSDRKQWEEKGYSLPRFDREAVTKATKENPFWIHFGAGNIFRAFQANVVQNLLNAGVLDRGLVVAEGFDYEIIEKMNRPHDDYGILVTLKANGSVDKTVVGSVVESRILDSENDAEYSRLKEIFAVSSTAKVMLADLVTSTLLDLPSRDCVPLTLSENSNATPDFTVRSSMVETPFSATSASSSPK